MKRWISFEADDLQNENEKKAPKKKAKTSAATKDKPVINTNLLNFNFEKYIKPTKKEDLAVHSKKIQEVEGWLKDNVLTQTNKDFANMLLICGPTGSGKTTSLQVLCKILGIDISEWVNPVDENYEDYTRSQTGRFLEFLNEAKYPSLMASNNNKIVLIEDFPNSVIKNPSDFQMVLEKCHCQKMYNIVFICTDTGSTHLNLAQNLFPDEVREKYSIGKVSFNPCPPTILKAALKRVQTLMQKHSSDFTLPSQTIVEAIVASANGDIRCATNQYHFACLKGMPEMPIIEEEFDSSTNQKRKKKQSISKIKNMSRDETLGLFHGVGKVLNPKRKESESGWRLNCNLDTLIDELATQPMSIIGFLHENYMKYFGDIDDLNKAANMLSESQVLMQKFSGDRHDTLHLSLWMSVMGLMVYNEHRVTGFHPIKGPPKIVKKKCDKLEELNIKVTDQFFYNFINKNDRYHSFN